MKCRNIERVLSFPRVYDTCLYVNRNACEMRLCLILIYRFFLLTHFSTLNKSFTSLIMKRRNIETVLSFQWVYDMWLYINRDALEMRFCRILIYAFFLWTHFSTLKQRFMTFIMKRRNRETVLSFPMVYGTCLYVNRNTCDVHFC